MLELLQVSDLLLLERLKTNCVNYIMSLPSDKIKNSNSLLRASWSMNLPRLEQHITKLYAQNFDKIASDVEFSELILESAQSVVNREEADTVIFVDDLKWWLSRLHGFNGDDDIGILNE
ncbi:hypothetical protein HK100_011196, partial [Physocladia obscura]